MPEGPKAPNCWQTLLGLVTAAPALITAVVATQKFHLAVFQLNALLHPDRRFSVAQLYILNVADFKGVPAG